MIVRVIDIRITLDRGVTREMGEDPVAVCRYFARRKQMFPEEGQVDIFGVMKELVQQKYTGVIYPEHPRAVDAGREPPNFRLGYPGGGGYTGFAHNVAYPRAMLSAALAP